MLAVIYLVYELLYILKVQENKELIVKEFKHGKKKLLRILIAVVNIRFYKFIWNTYEAEIPFGQQEN